MAAKHFNTDMQTFNAWVTDFRVRRSNKQLIDKLILRSLISVLFSFASDSYQEPKTLYGDREG